VGCVRACLAYKLKKLPSTSEALAESDKLYMLC
jgi:hypothetical protein